MNIDVDSENDNDSEGVVPPARHETLWLSDGNVVLSTNSHLFRVHKSMLAKYSSFFRDILEIPNVRGGDGNGPSREGIG